MSNSILRSPPQESKIDLISPAAGIAAGATVAAVPSAVLGKIVLATTAAGTLASGGSLVPAAAAATLVGMEAATGFPVTRTAFALAAAAITGMVTKAVIKLGRAGVEAARQTWNLVATVADTAVRPLRGAPAYAMQARPA